MRNTKLVCLLILALTSAPSVIGQARQLTPATGRILLQRAMGCCYPVDYNGVAEIISNPSLRDFSKADEDEDPAAKALSKLIRLGLVTKQQTESSFPNIFGVWQGRTNNCSQFTLTFLESELPALKGTYSVGGCGYYSWGASAGEFIGLINSGDKVAIDFKPPMADGRWEHAELLLASVNPMTLRGEADNPSRKDMNIYRNPIVIKAARTAERLAVKQYTYMATPQLESLGMNVRRGTINGGTVKVDRLEQLLLSDPVRATARFYWHVDYNMAAQAITGELQASGIGIVAFSKQPDGRWVSTQYRLDRSFF